MKRALYTGTLRFPAGFHTGDGRRLGAVDQPLFRDTGGGVTLAGSSLAGVLRTDLERLAEESAAPEARCRGKHDCTCVVCRLMGPRAPETRRQGREEVALRASKLHVSGGRLEGAAIQVRDRVGLARRTRTAADQRKYDLELVEGGAEAPFELRLDDPRDDELELLEATLRRLAGGWLSLGGKVSSGPGRVEVTELIRHELDLADPQALVRNLLEDDPTAGAVSTDLLAEKGWLDGWELPGWDSSPPGERLGAVDGRRGGPPAGEPASRWDTASKPGSAAASRPGNPHAQIRLRLEIAFPWGFLVNSPAEALRQGFDQAYLRRGGDGSPVLPGSALKGSLRSRAEQILRTLGGDGAACDLNTKGKACHEKIQDAVDDVRDQQGEEAAEKLDFDWELLRHCLACRVFGSGRLASSVRVGDFHTLPGHGGAPRRQELVAIDRFTGGAAESAKFNAQSAAAVIFAGEIQLEIGPDRLESWGLGLLALVLRDLFLGDIPLGFGSGKGHNEYSARLTEVDRFWLHPPRPLAGAAELAQTAGALRWQSPEGEPLDRPEAVPELAGTALAGCLTTWVGELHRRFDPSTPTAGGLSHD